MSLFHAGIWQSMFSSHSGKKNGVRTSTKKLRSCLLVCVGVMSLLASLGVSAQQPTITPDESTTIVQSTKKIGINLNGPAYYGSGELYKNLLWRNPGFEPDLYRDKFAAYQAGTTTTFTAPSQYDPVVANFWKGATFRLYRGSPKALVCSGTIASNTTASSSTGPTYTFASACSTAVQEGDVIVLRNAISCTPEADWESSHSGWWEGVSGGGKLISECSAPYDGVQSLRLDATASGSSAGIASYIDSASYVSGILINGQYTISGYYKTEGSPTFTVTVGRTTTSSAGNPFSCGTHTFAASSSWTPFSFVCTGAETNQIELQPIAVSFTAQNGTVILDDVSFQKSSGTDATNTTVFRDELIAALKKHCAGASLTGVPCELRDWAGQNADEIDNTIKPLFQRRIAVNTFNYDYAGGQGTPSMSVGLEEFLELCRAVDAEPYYALPETTGADEGGPWMEYLNGATSTTYGAKRAANGQTSSWLTAFPSIHLAMGNENWNESQSGEGLGYRSSAPDMYYDYSTDAAGVWNGMRADSWPSGGTGIDLVLGFQDGNVNYGVSEAMTRTSATSGELAPYTQFYVGDVTPLTALWNPLMYEVVSNTNNTSTVFYQQSQAVKNKGKLNVYEFDNSTLQGPSTVTQSVLDSFTDAAGYGTATALQALQHLQFGIVDQNFFSLTQYYVDGPNGTKVHNWGAFIDMGGATNAIRPQELGMEMANAAIIGPMYSCPVTNPTTYNLASNHNGYDSNGTPAQNNIPQEYAYCFLSGMQRSMIVINVDITNSHAITFAGSQAPSGQVTMTRYAPSSISVRNEAAGTASTNTATQNVSISAPVVLSSPTGDTLPPYSITRYDWSIGDSSTTSATVTTLTGTTSLTAGQSGTYTAKVTSTASGTPSGTITFYDGSTVLGTQTLSSATATFSTSSLSAGTHQISALYNGDSSFASSQSVALTVTVAAAQSATATTLTGTTSLTPGQSATYTAKVSTTASGTPTGTVTFLDGSTTLGTGTLSAGTATFTTSTLSAGTHTITAVYSGDTNFTTSQSSVLQVVVLASQTSTTTSLTGPTSLTPGDSATFTATIGTSASGTPSGTVTFRDGSTVLGTVTLSSNTATLSSTLATGAHSITATYSGDSIFSSSTSNTLSVSVGTSATTTALTGPTSLNAGGSATLNATVSSTASGTPSGTITFKDGSTVLGTVALTSGAASYTSSALASGTHSITATYSGDASFSTSTSSVLTISVGTAATATTLTGSTSITLGESATYTAKVSSSISGTPTGSITFTDGTTVLATVTLASGVATYTTSSLTAGSHSITATYSGDTNYATSTSTALPVTVGELATSIRLTGATSLNPGQSTTYTATVSNTANGTPTGKVTFLDGTTVLAVVDLPSSGVATYTTSTLASGTHHLTASYAGDSTFAAAVSSELTVTVGTATTTTTLTGSTTVASGETATYTATVASATSGSVTGTVSFYDGSTLLASEPLTNASAAYSTTSLTPGTHTLHAVYSGDTNFTTSTSNTLTVTVGKASTTAVLTGPTSLATSQNGTFSVTVSSATTGIPTGTVTFKDGNTTLGSSTLNAAGVASYSSATLSSGSHTMTASYSGDANYAASNAAALTVTVGVAATTATLSGPTTLSAGASGTYTVKVSTTATGTPTGSVVLSDGTGTLSTVSLNASGTAIFTLSLTGGAHTLVATYSGDSSFSYATSNTITVNVDRAQTVTTLAGPSSVVATQSATFTAKVSATSGTPTGTVLFADGATQLGSVALSSAGTASYTMSNVSAGTHTITATYSGDTSYTGSVSSGLTLTASTQTSTTVLVGPTALTPGQTASYTVKVSGSSSGTPTGTVTFSDGSTTLRSVTLSAGSAVFTTSQLTTGTHSLVATYSGDGSFSASSSTPLSVNVSAASTTTTLDGPTSLTVGQVGTYAMRVTSATAGTPTGKIQLMDGSTVLASSALPATGVFSYTATTLSAGTHTLSAIYSGDTTFGASNSTTLTVTVVRASTTTSIVGPTSLSTSQQAVYTAKVTPSISTVPTGTVSFSDNGTVLGTVAVSAAGDASYSASSLSEGTHSITATYNGDSTFAGSAAPPLAVSVTTATAPDFSVIAAPDSLTIKQGSSGSATFTVTPVGGLTGAITLACSGLPTGATCALQPASLTLDGSNKAQSSTLTITTTGSSVASLQPVHTDRTIMQAGLTTGGALLMGFLLFWQRRRLSQAARLLLFLFALIGVMGISGCGTGTVGSSATGTTGTPTGTYQVIVTASSGTSITHAVQFSLVVTK